ncbi:ribonuclease H-like protein [Xylaria sp. FL1777]|nr:ribonuclease H-like protein [Xylaria sp. FL1777]
MTATPLPASRLWHPTRGISFSPSLASPALPTQSPRATIDVSVGASRHQIAPSQSIAMQNDAWGAATTPNETPTQEKPAEPTDLHVSVEGSAEVEVEVEVNEAEGRATDNPPPPVVEYKMLDDLFYAAKKSPPGSPESFWSYRQYRRTAEDGSLHAVKVHYCRSKHTMERVCQQYFMGEKVLGFDLEWIVDSTRRDSVKKNVSLIQLASPSRIGLFHVALFTDSEDMVGPSFRSIMEDPDVFKVGVSIKGDTTRLRTFLDIDSRGLMELSHLYRLVTYSRTHEYHNINRKLVPLATQVEEYLHLPLFKGQSVRSSDWSRALDMDQVLYSASDAYAGLQLYLTLEHHRRQLDPCPPTPHRAETNLAIQLAEGVKVVRRKRSLKADTVTSIDGCVSGSSEKATSLEDISIENEETTSLIVPTKAKRSTVSKEKLTSTPKVPERPKDSRVEVADDQVASYRTSHPESRSTASQLRAYYLWHRYDLSPATVAQLVREPPLKTITVVQYILSVVQSEKPPVDLDRLREVADFVPESTLWSRWPAIMGMISPTDS